MKYLILVATIFGINLLPAFGPPTSAVLVFTRLHWHLNPVALVLLGGIAAMSGRYLLAVGASHFKHRLPARLTENLEGAKDRLTNRKHGVLALTILFGISPLPSAQLFIAAGLLDLPLLALTFAFFVGRIISYSIYVGAATLAEQQFGSVIDNFFGSPLAIAIQIVFLVAVIALPFINWKKIFNESPT
jgi:membrane protein YqaA with SNARE-associated domain